MRDVVESEGKGALPFEVPRWVSMALWLVGFGVSLWGIWWGVNWGVEGGQRALVPARAQAAGCAAVVSGEWEAALESFSVAIAENPGLGEAWLGRAECRLRTGDYEGALGDVLEARRRGVPEERLRLPEVEALHRTGKDSAALKILEDAPAEGADCYRGRMLRGEILVGLERIPEALQAFDRAAVLGKPEEARQARLRAAEGLLLAGSWREAADRFAALTGDASSASLAWIGLGITHLARAAHADAERAFGEALLLQETQGRWRIAALEGRALALRRLDRNEEASVFWNLADSVRRDDSEGLRYAEISDAALLEIYFGKGGIKKSLALRRPAPPAKAGDHERLARELEGSLPPNPFLIDR